MAGIFGTTNPKIQSEGITNYAKRLKHTHRIQIRQLPTSFQPALGIVYFEQNAEEAVFLENELCAIALCGIAYDGKKRSTIENLIHLFCTKGIRSLWDLDGTYTIYVKDKIANLVYLFTDPYGTQNIYYTPNTVFFSFAPEAKLLFPFSQLTPRLSIDGVIQILNNKYTFGETTMFEDVKQLEAGVSLQYDLTHATLKSVRYWDLVFEHQKMSLKDAANSIKNEVFEAHQTHYQDLRQNDKYYLFLTGGLDSRGNLAISEKIGLKPTKAITWGVKDDIPRSDPEIAKQLAKAAGVPFQFCQYDESTFLQNAKKWVYISEMRSFNLGSFAAGEQYFAQVGVDDGKFYVIGDHIFGAGGYAENVYDAILHTLRVPKEMILPYLNEVFTPEAKQEIAHRYQKKLFQVIENAKFTNFKDLQDYLNFHIVTTRWLFAPGNFKDPILPVRRPFLLKNVVELIQRLPPFLRVDKKAFYQMMKSVFPNYMKYPFQGADSIIDWKNVIRTNDRVKNYLLPYLDPDFLRTTTIGSYLDQNRFQTLLKKVFSSTNHQVKKKYSTSRFLFDLRKKITVNPVLGKVAKYVEPIVVRVSKYKTSESDQSNSEVVLKIALIAMFCELIENGTFQNGWNNPEGNE